MKYVSILLLRSLWLKSVPVSMSDFAEFVLAPITLGDNLLKMSISRRFFSNEFAEDSWASALDRVNLKLNLRNLFVMGRSMRDLTENVAAASFRYNSNFIYLSRLFFAQQQRNWVGSGLMGRRLFYSNFSSAQMLQRAIPVDVSRSRTSLRSMIFDNRFEVTAEQYSDTSSYISKAFWVRGRDLNTVFLPWGLGSWSPKFMGWSGSVSGDSGVALQFNLVGQHYLRNMLFFVETVYSAKIGYSSGFLLNLFFCWLSAPFRLINLTKSIVWPLKRVGCAASYVLHFGIFFREVPKTCIFSYIFRFSKYFVDQFGNAGNQIDRFNLNFLKNIILTIRALPIFKTFPVVRFYTRRFLKIFDWFIFFFCGHGKTVERNSRVGVKFSSFFSVGVVGVSTRKRSYGNTAGQVKFRASNRLAGSAIGFAVFLLGSLESHVLSLDFLGYRLSTRSSDSFGYKKLIYLRWVLGGVKLYNRMLLESSVAQTRKSFVHKIFLNGLFAGGSAVLSSWSSSAWLGAYHTACSFRSESSFGGPCLLSMHTLLEDRLVVFSTIGGGGHHADFFFTVADRVSYLRSTLRETLFDLGTFKVDALFEAQKLKLLTVDWFDVASVAVVKSAARAGSGCKDDSLWSRLSYRVGILNHSLDFQEDSLRFFFNWLDSDSFYLSRASSIPLNFADGLALIGAPAELRAKRLTSQLWGIAKRRKYISLSRLRFKRKRFYMSAQLYWGYNFVALFFSF